MLRWLGGTAVTVGDGGSGNREPVPPVPDVTSPGQYTASDDDRGAYITATPPKAREDRRRESRVTCTARGCDSVVETTEASAVAKWCRRQRLCVVHLRATTIDLGKSSLVRFCQVSRQGAVQSRAQPALMPRSHRSVLGSMIWQSLRCALVPPCVYRAQPLSWSTPRACTSRVRGGPAHALYGRKTSASVLAGSAVHLPAHRPSPVRRSR